jgi:hypothetical protein
MAVTDVRKTLPKGVNDVDMNERGERRGSLAGYGNPYEQQSVYAAMRAWGVQKWWLINHRATVTVNGLPRISNDGGPRYMLLFPDGKWRYATFGGLNGPPWFYCPWEGWEAPNGETAHLQMLLDRKIDQRATLLAQVTAAEAAIVELGDKLTAASKNPERSDETWKAN